MLDEDSDEMNKFEQDEKFSLVVGTSSISSSTINQGFVLITTQSPSARLLSAFTSSQSPVLHQKSNSNEAPLPSIINVELIRTLYRCPFHNVFNYTSQELDFLLTSKHYISGWLCLLVILVGLIVNSITISALLHKYMRKSSTNAYLLALALSNLCSLMCLLLMSGARFTFVHPYRLVYCKSSYENFINRALPWLTPVNNLFQLSGIYLIMAVSIDRLVIVRKQVKPTIGNRRRRKLFTWLIIFIIYLFSFIFTLPNWFLYESVAHEINITDRDLDFESLKYANGPVTEWQHKSNGNTAHVIMKLVHHKTQFTKFGMSANVKAWLSIYLYIPFVFGIPILVLVGVNALIIYELFKISARKRQLGTAARLDRQITLMLVAIVLVFLICQVPLAISHMLTAYQPMLMFNRHFFIYQSFTSFLTCVNLSANFGLFLFFGQAFRDTIQFMFCMRDSLPDSSHHSKRAPSLFFNTTTDFSRRGSSFIQSVYNTLAGAGSRKGSACSSTELRFDNFHSNGLSNSKYMQHRKSLPAVLMEKIIENENHENKSNHINKNNDENDDDVDEGTSFNQVEAMGTVAKNKNSKNKNKLPCNHVRFKDSIVSKSSSSLRSNKVRRFSEQFPKSPEFNLN